MLLSLSVLQRRIDISEPIFVPCVSLSEWHYRWKRKYAAIFCRFTLTMYSNRESMREKNFCTKFLPRLNNNRKHQWNDKTVYSTPSPSALNRITIQTKNTWQYQLFKIIYLLRRWQCKAIIEYRHLATRMCTNSCTVHMDSLLQRQQRIILYTPSLWGNFSKQTTDRMPWRIVLKTLFKSPCI